MKSLMNRDPFRMLRTWEPFDDLRRMQREMDRLFVRLFGSEIGTAEKEGLWVPALDSFVKDDHLVFRSELPGVDPKDLEVSIMDREVVITGERRTNKEEKDKEYLLREISYGAFERHFSLPAGVQTGELKATFENGILEITVPAPAGAKARKIDIEIPKKLEGGTAARKAA